MEFYAGRYRLCVDVVAIVVVQYEEIFVSTCGGYQEFFSLVRVNLACELETGCIYIFNLLLLFGTVSGTSEVSLVVTSGTLIGNLSVIVVSSGMSVGILVSNFGGRIEFWIAFGIGSCDTEHFCAIMSRGLYSIYRGLGVNRGRVCCVIRSFHFNSWFDGTKVGTLSIHVSHPVACE